MALFRTDEMDHKYRTHRKNISLEVNYPLCGRESIQEFEHWKIIDNRFPYDRIAEEHHMIVPKRHVMESDLSNEEIEELKTIRTTALEPRYEYLIEPVSKLRSIPTHFHLHIISVRKDWR